MFIISFCAPKDGVGRTLAAVHSAWLLTNQGYRVLLCDFAPEHSGVAHFPLMPDAAAGADGWMEKQVVTTTAGFDVLSLPAGEIDRNASPLREEWQRAGYDYVLVDAPACADAFALFCARDLPDAVCLAFGPGRHLLR